jgi:ATP-dependent DNA helicase RecQ
MHDTSLDELCQRKPRTLSELREVPGFGKRKTELYGDEILSALKSYIDAAPRWRPVTRSP